MQRLLLRAFSVAIIAVAIGSFSSASMAVDASPKTPAAPESSAADNPSWAEYKKLLENYYFLDKQKAGNISCNVSSPALQDAIDVMRQKYKNAAIIDANLTDFSVSYDHTKGLSFNSPHIKVNISPDAKLADDEQAENWRKGLEKLFDERVVGGVEGIIAAQVDMNLISPSPEKQKNLSLTKNGDVTIVSFDYSENKHARIIYSGTTQERTNSSPTFNLTSTSDYQPLNGKLAVAHDVEKMTEGSTKSNATTSISYQDLGSALFPAQILMDVMKSEGTQQPKTQHVEIDFKDCKTSDLSP